jgi:hypothetical protein
MKQIRLTSGTAGGHYFMDMLPWLKENKCEHTYMSGKNEIVFVNDDDATAFMLVFGGTKGDSIESLKNNFPSRNINVY